MCGGTGTFIDEELEIRGLSPRVRGNPENSSLTDTTPRSIPACAGEPILYERQVANGEVYPRVCGGTAHKMGVRPGFYGLSPRVRGNLGSSMTARFGLRSIPACAGEPWGCDDGSQRGEVYPRVCGGTSPMRLYHERFKGLSPRVRGNRVYHCKPFFRPGSIPACAGEPPGIPRTRPLAAVYPRVCGGTKDAALLVLLYEGLSPRVRGNHADDEKLRYSKGSIPACAGEPIDKEVNMDKNRVYPRVCGGTSIKAGADVQAGGLSPRVRGNPARVQG